MKWQTFQWQNRTVANLTTARKWVGPTREIPQSSITQTQSNSFCCCILMNKRSDGPLSHHHSVSGYPIPTQENALLGLRVSVGGDDYLLSGGSQTRLLQSDRSGIRIATIISIVDGTLRIQAGGNENKTQPFNNTNSVLSASVRFLCFIPSDCDRDAMARRDCPMTGSRAGRLMAARGAARNPSPEGGDGSDTISLSVTETVCP
ncbi:hypothetical protein EVAR_102613_1 [Eumeta japonica]|uniref:Uncharacterized protein n=1 Tax=Eumeta variegata TaxID=151549 RepID=A0A4C1TUR1_EUMVA|nr:hypothetical protein EVAR_102613_1 [Eumeta japonica]